MLKRLALGKIAVAEREKAEKNKETKMKSRNINQTFCLLSLTPLLLSCADYKAIRTNDKKSKRDVNSNNNMKDKSCDRNNNNRIINNKRS